MNECVWSVGGILLIADGRSHLIDKKSSVKKTFFFAVKGFMFRTERSLIGLTEDLITGKMQLNAANTISMSCLL
jgi:hypothetical protein